MRRLSILATFSTGVIVMFGAYFLYSHRIDRPILYYYGAAPEAPQGSAFAILNPFRDRSDEANAERLIRDLRTNNCEQIVRVRLEADPEIICPVMRKNTVASMIWVEDQDRGTSAHRRTLV